MERKRLLSLQAGITFVIIVASSMGCLQIQGNAEIDNATISLTEFLAKGYDKAIRPDCDRPTDVHLDFYVESFGKIEEANLEFSVFMYFRQTWRDRRLANRVNETVTIQRDLINKLWFPDTYCSNAKKSDLMNPDLEMHSALKLAPDGSIFYSRSAHIVASCEMDLRDFPMDIQHCKLIFGSYGYTDKDIKLSWASSRIDIANKEMAQFSVKDCELSTKTMEYISGNFTLLTAAFPMYRRIGYYVIQMYVPCTFLVMLSWIVFWMNPEETANRLTVGITTILTIVFLLGYTNSTLPKVSYVKGMDWYLMVSFLFIFLSLIECIVVDKVATDARKGSKKKKKSKRKQVNKNGFANFRSLSLLSHRKNSMEDKPQPKVETLTLYDQPSLEPNGNDFMPEVKIDAGAAEQNSTAACIYDPNHPVCCMKSLALNVDRCCRVLFPFLFMLYNAMYWYTYQSGVSIIDIH